jgi:ATP-dependent protease ClpP protease subunit
LQNNARRRYTSPQEYTGQPADKLAEDTDRDFYMMPGEAKDYGLIDEVIKTKTSHIDLGSMPSLD